MTESVILALVAIVGAVITALFKLLSDNTTALNDLVKSNQDIALYSKDGNDKAEARNGHLGEQNVQIAQMITSQNEVIADIKKLVSKEQHVEHQTVEHQEVKERK